MLGIFRRFFKFQYPRARMSSKELCRDVKGRVSFANTLPQSNANKIWRIPSGFRFTLLRYRLPALKANWHDSPMSHRYPKYNLQAASLIGEESEQPPPSSCYVFGQHSQRSQQIFGTHAV